MGGGRMDYSDMSRHYETRSYKSARRSEDIFTSTYMKDLLNPAKMKLPREACDSALSPYSKPYIFAEDITGSMDVFLLSLIQHEFPRLIKNMYENCKPDCVPHIMMMGVGDASTGARDQAPLQVTQFETDTRILEQLEQIYIEKGGGGNDSESYILPWYFAAKHTRLDCYDKRGEKGFLFTFGDECPPESIGRTEIRKVFGDRDDVEHVQGVYTAYDCLEMASKMYNCYHIILRGWYYNHQHHRNVIDEWRNLMGTHVCDLSDHHYLPELVVTISNMYEGHTKTEAIEMIQDMRARRVVKDALKWHEEVVETASNKNGEAPGIELF